MRVLRAVPNSLWLFSAVFGGVIGTPLTCAYMEGRSRTKESKERYEIGARYYLEGNTDRAAWRDYLRATGDATGQALFTWLADMLSDLTTEESLRTGRMAPLAPIIAAHRDTPDGIRTGTLHAAEHALWQREDRALFGE